MGRMKRRAGAGGGHIVPTLADLYRENRNLECVCRRCQHRRVLATSVLIGRFSGTATLPWLSQRLRCTVCNARGTSTATPTDPW